MTTEEESLIRTDGRRFGKGLAIIVIIMAIGAGINLAMGDFWNKYPPLVTLAEDEEPTGPEQPLPPGETVTITLTFDESADFRTLGFNGTAGEEGANPDIEITLGDTVVVTAINSGNLPHAFSVVTDWEDPATVVFDSEIRSASNPLTRGQEGTVEFRPTRAGEFYYVCPVPGHGAQGMRGNFIVNPPEGDGAAAGGAPAVEATGETESFDLTFVESADFRTLGFNALPGEEGANPTLRVSAGTEVTVNVVNEGSLPHSFAVVTNSENPDSVAFDSAIASPNNPLTRGATGEVTFVANRPGNYYYICTVPGHAAQGMQGEFIVE